MIYQKTYKLLSNQSNCSRTIAEILIKEKKIMVNGQLTGIGRKVNTAIYCININKKINCQNLFSKLFVKYKTKYFIKSFYDNYIRKPIIDRLLQKYIKEFYPIKNIDTHSRSIKKLTNKRRLCHESDHPKICYEKTYIEEINDKVDQNSIEKFQAGINLRIKKTNHYKIKILMNRGKFLNIKVILKEGMDRQIRRVSNLLVYKIADFKMTAFGGFYLDELRVGDWRLSKLLIRRIFSEII